MHGDGLTCVPYPLHLLHSPETVMSTVTAPLTRTPALRGAADLAGRTLLASLFVISGLGKLAAYAGTAGYMESVGVPGALLPLVIALEVVGGLAIVAGYRTRIVASLLAAFSIASARSDV